MKKLTKKEYSKLNIKRRNCGRGTPFIDKVLSLKKEEGLLITKKEWPFSSPPPVYFHSCSRIRTPSSEFDIQTRTLENETGWLIIRTR